MSNSEGIAIDNGSPACVTREGHTSNSEGIAIDNGSPACVTREGHTSNSEGIAIDQGSPACVTREGHTSPVAIDARSSGARSLAGLGVLVSGSGTNLQAILDAARAGHLS